MGTLGAGIEPGADQRAALCESLGLDPNETTGITVDVQPMSHVVVRWTGVRRLTSEQLVRLLDVFEEAGGPAPLEAP